MVALDVKDLALEQKADRWTGAADVAFIQQAGDGKILGSTSEMLNINMKDETYQRALKDGLVLVKGIFPAEGLNQIRVLVLDRSKGTIGSLRVPAPKK